MMRDLRLSKKLGILLIVLAGLLVGAGNASFGQAVGDYGTRYNTGTSTQWATGSNWVICTSAGTWTGATTASAAPTNTKNVWIRTGANYNVAATSTCLNLNIESTGALVVGGNTFTVSGLTSISGSFFINSNTNATKTFTGLVTVNTGGSWTSTVATNVSRVVFRGGVTNNSSNVLAVGGATFNTNDQNLNGTGSFSFVNATVTGINLTNNGTLSITTALSGTGTLTNSSSGILNLNGAGAGSCAITILANAGIVNRSAAGTTTTALANFTNTGTINISGSGIIAGITNNAGGIVNHSGSSTITSFNNATATSMLNISTSPTVPTFSTLTVSAAGNTVNYFGGGAQTVKAVAYSNLVLSGGGIKSILTGTSVKGNLSIAPTGIATAGIAAGQNIKVGSLTLGGTERACGTWGYGPNTPPDNKNQIFFANTTGYLTVGTIPSTPLVGTITHPTCAIATGSVVLSGLPSGVWTINPGSISGSGSSTTISGLVDGTYNFTVTNSGGCISPASGNVVINAQPVTAAAPTIGTITQPTCAVATGSVDLNGLPATGTWTLIRNPGGTTTTGTGTSTIIAGLAAGTYTYTIVDNGNTCPGSGTGLYAEYFNNMTLTAPADLVRTDATVNFNWGTTSPDAAIGIDNFSVRWTGKVQPCYSENYTFTTTSDDGIRLWVNGISVIDNWTDHGVVTNTGSINLTAGQKYDIVLEFYENGGDAIATLSWNSPSQPIQVIPQSQLYLEETVCTSASSTNVIINAQPTPPSAATASTTIQPTCAVATGTIVVSAPIGAYEYNIDGGDFQSSVTFTNVAAGSHSILVRRTGDITCISSATLVSVNAQPATPPAPNITPDGPTTFCAGGNVNLTSSAGSIYLWSTGATTPSINVTTAGSYTVQVTNAAGCQSAASAATTVTVNSYPTVFDVTGGGAYCSGGSGVAIGLDDSESVVEYQLYNGVSAIGSPVSGTGSSISFGNQTSGGSYTVVATSSPGNCTQNMNGNAFISISATIPSLTASITNTTCPADANGAITVTTSVNNSVEFNNAENDYINLGATILSGRAAFTMEGWVRFNKADLGSRMSLFGQNDAIEFGFSDANNIMCWSAGGGSVSTSISNYPDDYDWHHLAVVGNGTNMVLYIDGGQVASGGSGTSNYGSDTNFSAKIGSGVWDGSGGTFSGQIKKVGLWGIALNSSQVATLASGPYNYTGAETGLIAGYNFSEGSGTSLSSLPPGNTGSFSSTPEWVDVLSYSWTKSEDISFSQTTKDISGLTTGEYNLTATNGTCTTSNSFTVSSVNTNLSAVTISPNSAQSICASGTGTLLTVAETGGGTITGRQWGKRSTPGGAITTLAGQTASTYTPTGASLGLGTWYVICTSTPTCGSATTSNEVTVTVNSDLPVSISISAPENPVCAGNSVTYTAVPIHEGATPVYQWQVNGTNAGTDSPTFSYTPVNADFITCILTSNATCATGSPATSNTITMVVNANLTPTVSISADPAGVICFGTPVTFTASPTNGGSSPAYQWYSGSNPISGETGTTFTSATLINGETITVQITSNETCLLSGAATSNPISMTVDPTITLGAMPVICVNVGTADIPYSATTGNPTNYSIDYDANANAKGFQDFSNYPIISSSNLEMIIPNGGYGVPPGIYQGNLTVQRNSPGTCVSQSYPISVTISSPVEEVSVSINVDFNPVCAGTSVTFSAIPVNGGSAPIYQWKVNGTDSGTNSATYTAANLANGDLVTCELTSNGSCASGNSATSNTLTMAVNPTLPASVSIAASANPVCDGTSVTFTATPTNGGTPSYQWYNGASPISGETNSTYTTATIGNGDAITVQMTSNATCASGSQATSNTVIITVNPNLTPTVSIDASPSGSVCAGASVTFTATAGSTGAGTVNYDFKIGGSIVQSGVSNSYTSTTLASGNLVTCDITVTGGTCLTSTTATSNTVTMTVNPNLAVSVSIGASANPVCAGTNVTFTASPINGGLTPTYQWKKNGGNVGSNSSTYTDATLAQGDLITCELTSSETCTVGSPAISNTVTMTVNPTLPASVFIAPSANPVCEGTSVTFSATPTNGGTPGYQWYIGASLISGETNSTYTTASFANGDAITVKMTSDATCATDNPATSNTVTMTVNPNLTPTVSISASPSEVVCEGTSVAFTATAVSTGDGTVNYDFKIDGSSVQSGASNSYTSTTLANGNLVTCDITVIAGTCLTSTTATSNTVTMTVKPNLPVSVSIGASANPVCAGTSVTFTATPANGGSAPSYQWKVNGINAGSNSSTFTYTPSSGEAITCELTSNVTCATGSPATSNTVSMTVNPNLPVSVSIGASANPVCAGTSVTFAATPTNGGANPSYQWKVDGINAGSNSSTFTYTPSSGEAITCDLISNATCATGSPATSNTVSMTVNPNLPVSVSIGASANPVCAGTSVTFTVTPANGGSAPSYQWKVDGINSGSNSSTFTYTPSSGEAISCELTSNATCATGNPATSNTVTMTVNSFSVAPTAITGTTTICEGVSTTLTLSGGTAGTGATAEWFTGSCGGTSAGTGNSITVSPASSTTYFVRYNGVCNTTTCASVTVTVNTPSVAPTTITGTTTICEDGSTVLTVSGGSLGTGADWQWYSGSCGGTLVGTSSSVTVSPITNTTFFVRAEGTCNITGCTSTTIIISPLTEATVFTSGATSICQNADDETYVASATNSTSIVYSVLPVESGSIDSLTGVMNWDAAFIGNAVITATSSGLCGTTSADRSVTVNPLPTPEITTD